LVVGNSGWLSTWATGLAGGACWLTDRLFAGGMAVIRVRGWPVRILRLEPLRFQNRRKYIFQHATPAREYTPILHFKIGSALTSIFTLIRQHVLPIS
jgi:hypothetical protein